jgi:hypothetical protein
MSNLGLMRRLLVLLIVLPVASGACGGGRSPSAPSDVPPPGATQACRVFATEWSSTYTFAAPTTSSASFNAVDRTYTEVSPAGSSQAVRRVIYGSVADFIDEAAVFGRFLSRRTETCPTYDEATRTLATGPSGPGTGPFCFGLAFALSQRFDANGNVVSETDVAGGTPRPRTTTSARRCRSANKERLFSFLTSAFPLPNYRFQLPITNSRCP